MRIAAETNEIDIIPSKNKSHEKLTEKELFNKYAATKDIKIRNELINRHLYIAEILSKKFLNKGIEYEDIFQVASLGLIYAIERFDVGRGFEFSSFATPTIIGEIKKYFRDKGWSIRVPRGIQELSKKINMAKNTLQQTLQRVPTVKDIAEYLNCTEEEIIEAMEASQVYTSRSLDLIYDNDGENRDIQLLDIIGEIDKRFDEIENKDFLKRAMKRLNEVEKRVLEDRFFKGKTQMKVAKELQVSQMTISRMEKRIIEKFRMELKKSME